MVGFSVKNEVNGSAYDSGLCGLWTRERAGSATGDAIGAGAGAGAGGAPYTSFLTMISASMSLNLGNMCEYNENERRESKTGSMKRSKKPAEV